jgi:hypothetical protein
MKNEKAECKMTNGTRELLNKPAAARSEFFRALPSKSDLFLPNPSK